MTHFWNRSGTLVLREERTSPPDGFFLVDKPAGITSHDVIAIARRALGVTRIGHAGTLDPDATGLLLLCVGRATRLMPYIEIEPKGYDAEISFGIETDTDDASGETVRDAPIPDAAEVQRAIAILTGELRQEPPAFSAKQRDGRRAYHAARRGRPLTLEEQTVHVHEWSAVRYENGVLHAHIVCGGGTYIRALARDLGRICESAAHLTSLRRTRIGTFSVNDAVPAQTLNENIELLLPPLAALPTIDRVLLSEESERKVSHGMRIPVTPAFTSATSPVIPATSPVIPATSPVIPATPPVIPATSPVIPAKAGTQGRPPWTPSSSGMTECVALVGEAGNLVAIAELHEGDWKPRVVLTDG